MANAFVAAMSNLSSVGMGIRTGMIYAMFASPLIIAIFFILMQKKYRNTIILRQKTSGDTDRILVTKFAIIKRKGDFEKIRTFKRRLELPIPPEDAIDIQENGSWYVEGYLTEGGEVTWVAVDAKHAHKEIEIVKEVDLPNGTKHQIKTKETKSLMEDITLTRLSTQDKSFYFNRERKANDKYAVHGFWDFVNRNAGVIGLVMVVFVLFLFWSDIMQPALDAKEIDKKRVEMELRIVDKLDYLIRDRQIIADAPVLNTSIPTEAPE